MAKVLGGHRPGHRLRPPASRPRGNAEPGGRRPHPLGGPRPRHRGARPRRGAPAGPPRGEGRPADGGAVLGGLRPFPRRRRADPDLRERAARRLLDSFRRSTGRLSPRDRRGTRSTPSPPTSPASRISSTPFRPSPSTPGATGADGVARGRPRLRRVHVSHAGPRRAMVVALRLPDRARARALSGLRRAPGRHGAHGPVRRGRGHGTELRSRGPARPRLARAQPGARARAP